MAYLDKCIRRLYHGSPVQHRYPGCCIGRVSAFWATSRPPLPPACVRTQPEFKTEIRHVRCKHDSKKTPNDGLTYV